MFGGTGGLSSLYGNMATQQQQNQQQYSGQSPWNNFSNFGLGSLWGGGSGQHPGLGSWGSPSYSRYEAPSSESVQEFGENQQQMMQQQMEQDRQYAEQQRQQGIEQQRYQNQLSMQPQQMYQRSAAGGGPHDREAWASWSQQQQMMPTQPTTYQGQIPSQQPQPQQMDRASMLNMIQGLF